MKTTKEILEEAEKLEGENLYQKLDALAKIAHTRAMGARDTADYSKRSADYLRICELRKDEMTRMIQLESAIV